MPKIFLPGRTDVGEFCRPIRDDDYETINVLINGTPRLGDWTPIQMHLVREDEGKRLQPSDSPWLGPHALVFKQVAMESIGPILADHGELLPVSGQDTSLWLFNPTRVLDALDEDASTISRLRSGRIWRISQYIFKQDAVSGVDLFKIQNLRVSPTFVSERFVDLWKAAGLSGLEFDKVWSG